MEGNLGCLRTLFSRVAFRHRRAQSTSSNLDQDVSPPMSPTESKASERSSKETLTSYINDHGACLCCNMKCDTKDGSLATTRRNKPPSYSSEDPAFNGILKPEILDTVDATIDQFDSELRQLSLDIWEHPELAYEERYAHDTLTSFMTKHGFNVTRHYLGLKTAWRAEFSYGKGGRVIGLQSEMDALPNIGHACGHNLIAILGVAVALGLKAALKKHQIAGRVVLLGTPAEENGGGKIQLLEKGAYEEMDVCMMAHPGPGPLGGTYVQPWIAVHNMEVEFFGHSAHASYAPWEAQNALDAAFLAYAGISVLRQQTKPTCRVHGVISGKDSDWEPNVIPDYAKMRWGVRAPTWAEVEVLRDKVVDCFEGAGRATSCKVKVTHGVGYKDCKHDNALTDEYLRVSNGRYGMNATTSNVIIEASTDFGNVSYALPTIQPVFAVPVSPNGSNHTPQFTETARTIEAHKAAIMTSKSLAVTALRVLRDDAFFEQVREPFINAS